MQHLTCLALQRQDFVAHLPLQLHGSACGDIPSETYSSHASLNVIVGRVVGSTSRKSAKSDFLEGVGEGEGEFTRLSQATYDDRFEQGLICSSSGKFRIYSV